MLAQRVGENIKRARKERGLSLEKVAARINPPTSYQQLSRLEKGERGLDLEWIEKIAGALGVTPLELITGEKEERQPIAFTMSEQVANEVARVLGQVALGGEEPDAGTLQVLAAMLQELAATFLEFPEAYDDLKVARPVLAQTGRRFSRAS